MQCDAEVEVIGESLLLPVGVSCMALLREMSHCGRNLLRHIPASRWDLEQAGYSLHNAHDTVVASRVRHGGTLRCAELFAHNFFGISAAEAAAMDPQQRQLLHHGYAALHAAGMSKSSLLGAGAAVNVGQWASEFGSVLQGTPAGHSVYASTGFSC